jgi:uncharacterized protein YoxC
MSNDSNRSGGGFAAFVRGFFKLVFWMAVLAGLAYAGYLAYQELTRSFDSVQRAIEANEKRVDLLREETDALMAAAPTAAAGMAALTEEQARASQDIQQMEESMLADLAVQGELVAALQAQSELLLAQTETITGNVAALNEGVRLLQDDLNENWATTDDIGGSVDEVAGDVAFLQEEAVRLEEAIIDPGSELERMQKVLLLFQVWQLTSRARIRLLEGNAGLAASDITTAVRLLDSLEREEASLLSAEDLASLRVRLELALDGLPENITEASADLELAWDRLDILLAALLIGANAVDEEGLEVAEPLTPEATATGEAGGTPEGGPVAATEEAVTPTVAPTETPAADDTATPEPTP